MDTEFVKDIPATIGLPLIERVQLVTSFSMVAFVSYLLGHVFSYYVFDKNVIGYKRRYLILTSIISTVLYFVLLSFVSARLNIILDYYTYFIFGFIILILMVIYIVIYLYKYEFTDFDTNYRYSRVCLCIAACMFFGIPMLVFVV